MILSNSLLIFWIFFKATLLSFGGMFSLWAIVDQKLAVDADEDRKTISQEWTTHLPPVSKEDRDFILTVSNLIPGPKATGLTLTGKLLGSYYYMLAILAGMILPGFLLAPLVFHFGRWLKSKRAARLFVEGAVLAVIAILLLFVSGLVPSHFSVPLQFRFLFIAFLVYALQKWKRVNPLVYLIFAGGLGMLLF